LKALSIRQPYAEWIASKKKKFEVRSWRTHYRGQLVICSSQRPDDPEYKHLHSINSLLSDSLILGLSCLPISGM
jgi:hypothetical protein